jgi:cytochrome c553
MDHWRYPIGTKIWKEFTRGDTRVETRLIEKRDDSLFGWFMMAYAWNAEQTQATAVPEGAENVLGTEHDIPSSIDCRTCHFGMPDKVLGFTALQLAHTDAGLTLQAAVEAGLLTEAPTDVELALPGTAVDQVALGYLHANCGHCHNPGGAGFERSNIELLLSSSELENVQDTAAYRTSVNVPLEVTLDGYSLRIDPGAPSSSGLLFRMGTRGEGAMPPLASELVHDAAVSDIDAWIRSLR